MKPVAAEFVTSAAWTKQFPADGLPEIALVGRSNVGKSSLINALLGQRLARTSNTPGRTQTLNWYRIWPAGPQAAACYFVDMPGYGFAKVSQAMRKEWQRLIEGYLTERSVLRGVIQVIDLRHPPTEDDQLMGEWLRHQGRQRLCAATKADKLKRSELAENTRIAATTLGVHPLAPGAPLPATDGLLPFSAEAGLGREALWGWVRERVGI